MPPFFRPLRGHTDPHVPEDPEFPTVFGQRCPANMRKGASHLMLHDFTLLMAIGSGNHSTIFHAVHRISGTQCVIKICMKARLHGDREKRIRREIEIHSQLVHPHILPFYAAFEDKRAFYIVVETALNGDLYDHVRHVNGSLDERGLAKIVLKPLLLALSYLHGNEVLHRDIKPENILLDERGKVQLCDFGLAIDCYHERPRSHIGTLEYMPPEVILRKKEAYGKAMDVWAIGVLTYECLSQVSPFLGESDEKTIENIVDLRYAPLSDISSVCKDFLARTLNADPSARATVNELLAHPFIDTPV